MLVLFAAFPAPITVLGTKCVPVNSHSMNKDGGLVLQFQLKMKKKKKKSNCWQVFLGKAILVKVSWKCSGKSFKCIFRFTKHPEYTERNRDYRGKGGCLCIYIYPIWDSCHFILLFPKFGLLLLPDAQRTLTRSPIIIIFLKKTSFWLPCLSSKQQLTPQPLRHGTPSFNTQF